MQLHFPTCTFLFSQPALGTQPGGSSTLFFSWLTLGKAASCSTLLWLAGSGLYWKLQSIPREHKWPLIRQYQPATVLLTGNYMYKTLATAISSLALYGRNFFYSERIIIILAVEEAFGVCYVVKFTILFSLSWLGPRALWLSCCFLLWSCFLKFKVFAFLPQYRFLLMFLIFAKYQGSTQN